MEVQEIIEPNKISYGALVCCGHYLYLMLYEPLRWMIARRRHLFMEEQVVQSGGRY